MGIGRIVVHSLGISEKRCHKAVDRNVVRLIQGGRRRWVRDSGMRVMSGRMQRPPPPPPPPPPPSDFFSGRKKNDGSVELLIASICTILGGLIFQQTLGLMKDVEIPTGVLPDGLSRDQYGHVLVQLREGVSLESRASSRTPGELLFRGPSGEVFEINSDYVQVDLSDNAVLESLFGDKSWKEKLHPVVTGEGEPLKMSRVNFWNATL